MNILTQFLVSVYSRMLNLYPRRFREEFSGEMHAVFRNSVMDAAQEGTFALVQVFGREFMGMPFHILKEFLHEFGRKEMSMATNEKLVLEPGTNRETGYWGALMGILPFALYGIAMILGKSNIPFHSAYIELTFNIVVLLGLLVGMVKGFPQWAYCYLGWSMVMSWWWMMMPVFRFNDPSYTMRHNQLIGWWSWIPLLITLGIGVLLARSARPLTNMVWGIWQDWTKLSLMIFTFVAFTQLIYDENHHPLLVAFMIGSTLVISTGTWMFLRSANIWMRIGTLLSGFLAASIIGSVCYSTWDWAAYYGFPPSQPEPWTVTVLKHFAIFAFWSVILFLPALIGFARRGINNRRMA
jgi:hypothetical protein